MRKFFYSVLAFMLVVCSSAFASPGDTIMVQTHKNIVITTDTSVGQTFYPSWGVFPAAAESKRRVIAYLTFECAPGKQCGEWDYLNHIYIGRTGGMSGDSLGYEISRFITPYGFYWNSASDWRHGWYMDVTDFAGLLHDSVEIIYKHTGYEANHDRGWKINLQFYVFEGTPVRAPVKITRLWNGIFEYGNAANPIDNNLQPKNVALDNRTRAARLWLMQTGHGIDRSDGCSEFCAKSREVKMDNITIDKRIVWRDNCGWNSLFPQAGTWLLDRGNWCPGAPVVPDMIDVERLSPGTKHLFDIDMQAYNATGNFGAYVFDTYLIEYSAPNATNDVTLEAIIAPSSDYEFLRYNPICGTPVVVIRNNGSQSLTSMEIEYGLKGGNKSIYHWTGNLEFLQADTIQLINPVQWVLNADATFEVELKSPNGASDQFVYDNKGSSIMKSTPVLPANFIIQFRSNKGAQEDSYTIKDAKTGIVVYQKDKFGISTMHRDTVHLQSSSCYVFEFSDEGQAISGGIDLPKDGLSFWYWKVVAQSNPQYAKYIESDDGSLQFRTLTNRIVKDFTATNGNIKGADFGTKIIYQFSTDNTGTLGIPSVGGEPGLEVYPNPSGGIFELDYYLPGNKHARLVVEDLQGKTVYNGILDKEADTEHLDLRRLPAGMYTLQITANEQVFNDKLVIFK